MILARFCALFRVRKEIASQKVISATNNNTHSRSHALVCAMTFASKRHRTKGHGERKKVLVFLRFSITKSNEIRTIWTECIVVSYFIRITVAFGIATATVSRHTRTARPHCDSAARRLLFASMQLKLNETDFFSVSFFLRSLWFLSIANWNH